MPTPIIVCHMSLDTKLTDNQIFRFNQLLQIIDFKLRKFHTEDYDEDPSNKMIDLKKSYSGHEDIVLIKLIVQLSKDKDFRICLNGFQVFLDSTISVKKIDSVDHYSSTWLNLKKSIDKCEHDQVPDYYGLFVVKK